MAEFDRDAFFKGWTDGIGRLEQQGFAVASSDADIDRCLGLLDEWPGTFTDRFVSLFAENVAVASSIRRVDDEHPVRESELALYLAVDLWFKNSWNCE